MVQKFLGGAVEVFPSPLGRRRRGGKDGTGPGLPERDERPPFPRRKRPVHAEEPVHN